GGGRARHRAAAADCGAFIVRTRRAALLLDHPLLSWRGSMGQRGERGMAPAIISFSASSAELALRVATLLEGRVHHCGFNGENPRALLPRLFEEGTPIVGVCAAGILIRILAPHLNDKHEEPPVLAVSLDAQSVVPLLGGHRGANQLA